MALDDPISALDAHVAQSVFDKALLNGASGRTRVRFSTSYVSTSYVSTLISYWLGPGHSQSQRLVKSRSHHRA